MYYRLYTNSKGLKQIDESKDVKDIIDTLEKYIYGMDTIDFIIKEILEDRDEIEVIHSIEDFEKYKNIKLSDNVVKTKKLCYNKYRFRN